MSVIILSLPRCQAEVETCRDTPIPPRVPLTAGKPIYRPYSVPSPPASLDLPLPLSSVDGRSAGESPLEEEGRVLLLERRVADMGCSCKIFRGNGPMSSSWEGCRREKSVQEQLQRHSGNIRVLGCSSDAQTLQISISRSLVPAEVTAQKAGVAMSWCQYDSLLSAPVRAGQGWLRIAYKYKRYNQESNIPHLNGILCQGDHPLQVRHLPRPR